MPLRRGAVALLAASVLALAACETSPVASDATIEVSGRGLAAGGAALADRPVRLSSEPTASDLLLALPTLGLLCATGGCGDALAEATTGADGAYRLTTSGGSTQTGFGGLRPLLATVSGPLPAGADAPPTATARFRVRATEVRLPDLRLVDPGLAVTTTGLRLDARWSKAARPDALVLRTREGSPLWRVPGGPGSARLDVRVLEGESAVAALTGTSASADDDVELAWSSAGLGVAAVTGPPLSRGAACGAASGECALTDGDLLTPLGPLAAEGGATPAPRTTVDVRLPAGSVVELVVVRGCTPACTVSLVSGTGVRRLATPVGDAALPVPATPVTAVRVASSDLASLREVSAWAPQPTQASPPVGGPATAGPQAAAGGADRPGSPGRPVWPLVLAVLLLVVAATGVGITLGRRPRRR